MTNLDRNHINLELIENRTKLYGNLLKNNEKKFLSYLSWIWNNRFINKYLEAFVNEN